MRELDVTRSATAVTAAGAVALVLDLLLAMVVLAPGALVTTVLDVHRHAPRATPPRASA